MDKANSLLRTMSDKLDCLIILDRRVDLVTPLLTQLTYEGLIDELIGIKNCKRFHEVLIHAKLELTHGRVAHVELPVSLLTPPAASNTSSSTAPSGSAAPAPTNALTKEKKKKHHLTPATDPLFAELRDLNFSAVGKKLNSIARRLDEDYKVMSQVWQEPVMCCNSFSVASTSSEDGCAAAGLRR